MARYDLIAKLATALPVSWEPESASRGQQVDWAGAWHWLLSIFVPAIVGVAGVAGLLYRAYGDRIFDHLLKRNIEAYKHGLSTGIEKLKAELAHRGDRGIRANELEFKAIIATWEKFIDAYVATYSCIVAATSYPNLDAMSPADVTEFLETTALSAPQRKQVLEADRRITMYSKIVKMRLIGKAGTEIFEARTLLRKQGVFIPKEFEQSFLSGLDVFARAYGQEYAYFDHDAGPRDSKIMQEFMGGGQKLIDDMKDRVRQHILANVVDQPNSTR